MSIVSRGSVARFAASAAALVAASLPVQGVTAVKTGQVATHTAQAATGIAAGLAGQHVSPLTPMGARADSRFSPDALHHWSP